MPCAKPTRCVRPDPQGCRWIPDHSISAAWVGAVSLPAMDGFLQRLRRHWTERFGSGSRHLVVAVSGGLDSMVLLQALHRLRRKFPWDLTVAHAHHGLRGAEADADADWVHAQATLLGIPCVMEALPVRAAAKASRESIEMAARRLRHAFLARTALRLGASDVVLAHHAGDQAELLLMRLLRGAGSEGLAGMRECSPSPADRRVTLLRPLLAFDRADLERFACAHGIRHREDASNRDLSIPRNRIRHQLIPDWIAHHSPALPRVLARVADIAAQDADYLREQARRWIASERPQPWVSLHVALQRAILRLQQIKLGRSAEFGTIERLRRARNATAVGMVDAGGAKAPPRLRPSNRPTHEPPRPGPKSETTQTNQAAREPRRQIQSPPSQTTPSVPTPETDAVRVTFRGTRGNAALPDGSRLQWKRLRRPLPHGTGWEQFDADTLPVSVQLRHRRPGDRFQPLGQPQAARLQNLFINRRVPATERANRWVMQLDGGSLAWVEGFPAGEPHRLGTATRRIVALRIVRPARPGRAGPSNPNPDHPPRATPR